MSTFGDRRALQRIYMILRRERATDWNMPEEFVHQCANELPNLSPAQALQRATDFIEEIRRHNQAEKEKFEAAKKYKAELSENPITNAGERGLLGLFQRQLLAFLNGTLNSLDRLEVTEQGLQLYQPFATVSQRTITYRDVRDRRVVLSVNPPAYLDEFLGALRQFRKKVTIPWGEIVVYEPGSGRNIASAIAFRPEEKIAAMTYALAQLHRTENQYENYKRLPRLVDLLVYYDIEKWEQILGSPDEVYEPGQS